MTLPYYPGNYYQFFCSWSSIYLSISRISPTSTAPSAIGETGQEPPFQSGDVCLGQLEGTGGSLVSGETFENLGPTKLTGKWTASKIIGPQSWTFFRGLFFFRSQGTVFFFEDKRSLLRCFKKICKLESSPKLTSDYIYFALRFMINLPKV